MSDNRRDDAGAGSGQGATGATAAFNETIMDPARRAGEAMKQSGQVIAAGGSALGLKMIEQAEANTREAFAAMRAAAGARDVAEVMKVQGDFLRQQGSRSMAQAREMGELIAQFGRDAVTPPGGGGGQN